MEENLLLLSDSYKCSHHNLYPPKTQKIYSYFESRGGEFDNNVFFGLQYIIKRYLEGRVLTRDKIKEADDIFQYHFGTDKVFNKEQWLDLADKHDGRLPIEIKAAREGSVIPNRNVLFTIENTDEEFAWLTNYLETLLVQLWYPCIVATQSREMKKVIKQSLEDTGDISGIAFKLNDFGIRGCTSMEQAAIGGAAHLINFQGTDNLPAIKFIRDYYGTPYPSAFSIPATEHSTITSWGKENELAAYNNLLEKYPSGIIACVSDSYDIENACKNLWGKELKAEVLSRDGVLTIRPDSGHPPDMVVSCLKWLGEAFGFTKNEKGYKVLNPKVRLIQGDGIDYQMLNSILVIMRLHGWSADNIAFGSGGGLLQKLNRDTGKHALKCSYSKVDNTDIEVYKAPTGDVGKRSKKGKLVLLRQNGVYSTEKLTSQNKSQDILESVFLNGKLMREQNFEEIVGLAGL
jgi:nicotinamide phosphoribosyltransferase